MPCVKPPLRRRRSSHQSVRVIRVWSARSKACRCARSQRGERVVDGLATCQKLWLRRAATIRLGRGQNVSPRPLDELDADG